TATGPPAVGLVGVEDSGGGAVAAAHPFAGPPGPSAGVPFAEVSGNVDPVEASRSWVCAHDEDVVIPVVLEARLEFGYWLLVVGACDGRFDLDKHRCTAVDQEVGDVSVAVERLVGEAPPDAGEERSPFGFESGSVLDPSVVCRDGHWPS